MNMRMPGLFLTSMSAILGLGYLGGCGDESRPTSDAAASGPEAVGDDTTAVADSASGPDDATNGADTGDGGGGGIDDASDVSEPVTTTWHAHVRPLVERSCNSCHQEGAVGGFALDDYDAIAGMRAIMVGRVLSGDMPPWPMDPNCREVQDARYLSAAEKAVFAAWRDGGYQRGNPEDFVSLDKPRGRDVGPAELLLTRDETYVADRRLGDDYRCFVYDHEVTEDMWVSGVHVLPDAEAIVHHVLVYVVPEKRVDGVLQRDAAAAGLGYPCLGGVGARGDEALLAGWVPGMLPMHFPQDAAFRVEAGSKFVVQMHYNTLNIQANDAVPPDATAFELWTLPAGLEPTKSVRIQPIADGDLDIRPGEARVVEGISFTSPTSATIIGVIPHMHMLGTEISVRIKRSLTPETVCLANVPKWDFHWQQVYQYEEHDHVPLYFGDTVELECVYDNSAANQPVVNGVRQEPRRVTWGEGTLDEMCLNYLVTTVPWGGAAAGTCPGADSCIRNCPPGDSLCPVQCFGLAGNACVSCAIQPLYTGCGQDHCQLTLALLGLCINGCSTPDNVLGCAVNECRSELDAHYGCLEGPMREGACDGRLSACDVRIGPAD